jgi:hypothetical protein
MIRMTMASSFRMLTLMTLLAFGLSPTDAGAQKSACGSDIRAIEINKATLHYFGCPAGHHDTKLRPATACFITPLVRHPGWRSWPTARTPAAAGRW